MNGTVQHRQRRKMLLILAGAFILCAGSAISQRFLLNHQITVLPRAIRSGSNLMALGAKTNTATASVAGGDAKSKERALKLSFETLGGWTYIEGKTPIPPEVTELNGKYVEMAGFMLPLRQAEKITEFQLIQGLWNCCYGKPPAVNHVVMVAMAPDKGVPYFTDPIRVRGRFNVGESRDSGFLVSLYRLEADEILAK